MKIKNTYKAFILSAILILTIACSEKKATKSSTTSATKEHVVDSLNPEFGFINQTRDSLLILPNDSVKQKSNLFEFAIIENKIVSIEFLKNQVENEKSNGRQTSYNFSLNGGDLFKINTKIDTGEFALLVNKTFVENNKIVSFIKKQDETDLKIKTLLEEKYKRKAIKSTTIAELENKSKINLTVFETKHDSALAVLSLVNDNETITLDYPAEYDETSTWRVDDGGEFNTEAIQILSILNDSNSIKLVVAFWGAEGYQLNLYESKNGVFKNSVEAYGYSAPL